MTIFRFVLKRFLRRPANIILVTLVPMAVVFIPVSGWFPLPMGFQYFGMALMFIAARMAAIVMEDRIKGTLLRVGLAPNGYRSVSRYLPCARSPCGSPSSRSSLLS
jgi:ABC-2 type transport system permease protein